MAKKSTPKPTGLVRVTLIEPHTLPDGTRLPVNQIVRVSAELRDTLEAAGKLAT